MDFGLVNALEDEAEASSDMSGMPLSMFPETIPDPPSRRLGYAVSAELEHALLACLKKNRAMQPQTARDSAAMLDRVAAKWTLDDAEAWWSRYERGQLTAQRVVALRVTNGGASAFSL